MFKGYRLIGSGEEFFFKNLELRILPCKGMVAFLVM